MDGCSGERTAVNSFALVAYLDGPLASFVEDLRRQTEPGCQLRAHLTILPPRILDIPLDQVWGKLRSKLQDWRPFRVELADVDVFRASNVIHLTLGRGFEDVKILHGVLAHNELHCKENFDYHPHVTLAQYLAPDQVENALQDLRARWAGYSGDRSFWLENLTLVQNIGENQWKNLGEVALGSPVPA